MSVTVQLPHAGAGTQTLCVAIEVPDELLTDPTLPDQVLSRVAELIEPILGRRRAAATGDDLLRRRGVTLDQLRARDRDPDLSRTRQDLALLLRRNGWTLTAIGQLLHRDHTTVIAMVRRAEGREVAGVCEGSSCNAEAIGQGRWCLRHYQDHVQERRPAS